MQQEMTDNFKILTASSVDEAGADAWDSLSGGRPFQSARWYRFGERVMGDCRRIYIILTLDDRPIARATFWVICDEPLPVSTCRAEMAGPHLSPLAIADLPLASFEFVRPDPA